MGTVAQLWRHPIKSHGREALESVTLSAGQAMPWDRHWAVIHDNAHYPGKGWAPCQNFMIGTRTPGLAGIWATLDEPGASVTLRHHDLGEISFAPDAPEDVARFLEWVMPLCPDTRARPAAVATAGSRGMTDSEFPSVSIMNTASHRAVSQKLGREIEPERWRGNIWLDGLVPWEEREWIGKTIRVGAAEIVIRDHIQRCLHTAANPVTGQRDTDTLTTLEDGWGHRDFGVYGEVVTGGGIQLGDAMEVL